MQRLHPIRLEGSLHETIWGGQRLELYGWKRLPSRDAAIGESWETEINTVAQNEPYRGKTLGKLVEDMGVALLGEQAIALFGNRFPLLAKFIDANAQLSVQVHPDDSYAAIHEGGKPGKTEFWYVLAAEPGATIVHGFKAPTSFAQVRKAIEDVTLENLLQELVVTAGDIIFVPAGTVHAIGSGVMLYELQQYSDITYRMYDYGRITSDGTPRLLHINKSLEVSHFDVSPISKVKAVSLVSGDDYEDRCLVACQYFVSREIILKQKGYMKGRTEGSCVILSLLAGEVEVRYGSKLEYSEKLARGQTMVLPAALDDYCIEGEGKLMLSYVPRPGDETWQAWEKKNRITVPAR